MSYLKISVYRINLCLSNMITILLNVIVLILIFTSTAYSQIKTIPASDYKTNDGKVYIDTSGLGWVNWSFHKVYQSPYGYVTFNDNQLNYDSLKPGFYRIKGEKIIDQIESNIDSIFVVTFKNPKSCPEIDSAFNLKLVKIGRAHV